MIARTTNRLTALLVVLMAVGCAQRYPWNYTYDQRYAHLKKAEARAIASRSDAFYDLVWLYRTNDTEIAEYAVEVFVRAYKANPDGMYDDISKRTWDIREDAISIVVHGFPKDERDQVTQMLKKKLGMLSESTTGRKKK